MAEGYFFREEAKEIEIVENPHADPQQTGCSRAALDSLLEPAHLIVHPMATQQDTFQDLLYAKVLTVTVPVYRVKQPERLSPSELQFQLVLVRDLSRIGESTVLEVPVDQASARDSWFLGYEWAPLVMECAEGDYHHVGWKYDSLTNNQEMPHFYALMVEIHQRERVAEVLVGGSKAPMWMGAALGSFQHIA